MTTPAMNQPPTPAEQTILETARAKRDRCVCGAAHGDDSDVVTPSVIARMKGYLAAHPGHQFAVDDEAGIVAAVILRAPAAPEVLAWSASLTDLLDTLGAPTVAAFS